MKKSTSRLLSVLLVLCMVLALLPGTALAAEVTTVYAGTVEELKAALKSNTTIILEGKDYILEGEGYFDYYISLEELENVTIRGTTGTRILSTSEFSVVMLIEGCKNIVLDNLVLGHDILPSSHCVAGVIMASNTEQLTITNCDIFGCGLEGIETSLSTITVEKSTIRDCSENILYVVGASMVFKDCVFSGNGYNDPAKYAVSVADSEWIDRVSELAFYNCTFRDNKNPRFTNGSPVVENCTFINNAWEPVVEIPVTGGSIYFNPTTGAIVDCDSDVTEAVIPSVFNGVAVTSIGGLAFSACTSLTSVTIPDSVTSIGDAAFQACSSLTSVTIPASVTSMGDAAFYSCSSLTNVAIPASVTSIGERAFYFCSSLTSVTIPVSVTSIGYGAFYYCNSLTSVTIPNSVTSIGKDAFSGCSSLTDVYYGGSENQWKQMEIDNTWRSNEPLLNADIHYNSPMPSVPDTPDIPDTPTPGPTDGRLDSSEGAQVAVFHTDETNAFYYATFEDAVAFFNDGTNAPVIFKLLTDCTCDSVTLTGIGFGATIDLAGHTLSVDNLEVASRCTLEIRDTVGGGRIFGPIEIYATPDNFVITGGTISDITENGQLWSLTDKTLTISGTGALPDYDSHLDVPWDYLTASSSWYVERIVVKDGITRIGDRAFAFYGGETLSLPSTLTEIGTVSLGFTELTYLEIPAGVTRVEPVAFDSSHDLTLKFLGSAPEFIDETDEWEGQVFWRCSNIKIYYPAGDESWTPYVNVENFGSENKITWIAYGSESADDYQITVPATSNGTVTVTPATAKSGEKVTITATPNDGYTTDSVTVRDSSGSGISVTDNGDGTYTFTMPASQVTVSVTFVAIETPWTDPFTDVSADAYYYDAVQWAVANGVTTGTGDGTTFSPDQGCTRAQFVTFLWRAAGSPEPAGAVNPFSDVSATTHGAYYKAILWAVEQGVTAGTGDGTTFSPDTVVIRAQSVTFMHRYAKKAGIATETGVEGFDDVTNEGAMTPYYDAIGWAVANGITNGNSTTKNTFGPMGDCIRGQMITFLHRLFTDASA